MSQLAQVGDLLAMYARSYPNKVGARDLEREMTFHVWYVCTCQLANALSGVGLSKGDRVCVLAYNCVEWLEIYAAAALAGLVVVQINFRLIFGNQRPAGYHSYEELIAQARDGRPDVEVHGRDPWTLMYTFRHHRKA